MNWMSRLFSQDGTKPAKKLGLASFTFESQVGGVIGAERARAALKLFDSRENKSETSSPSAA